MNGTTHIILIKESAAQSLISDAGTALLFAFLIGLGVWLESDAMQWVGALVGFTSVLARTSRAGRRLSVREARQRLDEIEAGGC